MKISIEARRTTRVPFLDSQARLERSWKARAEYRTSNVHDELTWPVTTRYSFSGLECGFPIPSSQLIIMEDGVPLTTTATVVSALKDRFSSEAIDDPFVIISDKVAGLKKSDVTQRRLAKALIERSWREDIRRNIKLENKTGKAVQLELTVIDQPASELVFVEATPAPDRVQPPEVVFELALEPEAIVNVEILLRRDCRETIRAPIAQQRGQQEAKMAMNDIEAFANFEIEEQVQQQQIIPPPQAMG